MAKYNLDNLLSDLGVPGRGRKEAEAPSTPSAPDNGRPGLSPIFNDVDDAPVPAHAAAAPAPPPPTPPVSQPPPTPPSTPAQPARAPEQRPSASARANEALTSNPAPPPTQRTSDPLPAAAGPALSEIYQPDGEKQQVSQLGEMLVASNIITPQQLTAAQQVIRQSPGRTLREVLVEQGADETSVQSCFAQLAGIPFERIDLEKGLDGGFDGKLIQRLGQDFCKQHQVIPLRTEGARIVIGATRTDDVFQLDEIRQKLNVSSIKLILVTGFDIRGALEILGDDGKQEDQPDLSAMLSEVEEDDVQVEKQNEQEVDLEKEAGESPVIRYVNYIIQTAVKEGASDIHIEPAEKKLKVRFRIDGELFEMMNPPASMAAAITSRLKIMANLDISERRIPQDGRIRCTVQGRKLDLRMSTLPSAGGEKTVLRILDTRSINVKLEDLGFHDDTLDIWKKVVESPHGIVLVTGPTGSGKTTTLYSSLRQLDKNSMNISTVEDPVEYHLDGITQTQTHERIGMTFATALRALLRQDPDVIMLGEVRDMETAHIAVQAALTGHLVLSTLHTNDAPSSITRLVNIGLEPFLVGAAVNAVLAQRLVRKLCIHCKAQEKPGEELAEFLELQGLDRELAWAGKGCDRCRHTGYSGRIGIYELLTVDDQLRDIVARNPNVAEFRRICIERGMVPLRGDGMRKVASGMTTVQEILRVTEANV